MANWSQRLEFATLTITILIISLFQLSAIAQAPTNIIVVKVGDEKTYQIDKYLYYGASTHTYTVKLQNGTTTNITVKKGLTFALRVCNVTPPNIYKQYIIQGQTTECVIEGPPDHLFDIEVFTISSRSYYQDRAKLSGESLHGNIYTEKHSMTTFIPVTTWYGQYSYDITTGWTTSNIEKAIYENGTLFYDIEISQVSNSNNNLLNESELVTLFIVTIVIIVIIILMTKKFNGLKGENKHKRTNRMYPSTDISKITNKLEEIMEENKIE